VFCLLEMLRLCLRSRVRDFINELPDSLDETYERILKGIHKTNQGHVQRLLQCLAVAIRPLRVDELAEILTFDPDAIEGEVSTFDADSSSRSEDQEQELLSACPSLITIVESRDSRVVQFSHFSVKEFLTSGRLATSREDISRYHILPEAAHTTLAQASLGVLLRLDDQLDSSSVGSIPLAEYAAEYWVSHAQIGGVSSRIIRTTKTLFDSDKPHFAAWVWLYDIDRPYPWQSHIDTATTLYYSALCGFHDLVEHLVKKHSQHVTTIGGRHHYPLLAALHGGHIRVAELLCQHGAVLDVQGREDRAPLHIVVTASDWPENLAVRAVQFLLEHGADINARRKDLLTPLDLAVLRGDLKMARVLLDYGANVNAGNNRGQTLLHQMLWADNKDRFSAAQLLIEHGADVNAQDNYNDTPLHLAPLFLELKLVQMLVNHGADVNAVNNEGKTPLHKVLWADNKDRFSAAQLLIEHGADVNAQDKYHTTPLHLAPNYLELELVQMLVNHGADVNAVDNEGKTPLHKVLWADNKDRFSAAQLLIEHGADVNAQDNYHTSPLHLAPLFLELKLVQMLVNYGADVNAVDNDGKTPLHKVLWADNKDCFSAAQLLIEHGADVNAQDNYHTTPLHLAPNYLELELVQMLVNHGADVNAVDNDGKTPLHKVLWANNKDRFSAAQLLIERGADVNAQDNYHTSPLHLAPNYLELELVQMLVDYGANVNAVNNQGQTPLHRLLVANNEDHFSAAQLLIEHGADVNAQDNNQRTPLHFAPHFLGGGQAGPDPIALSIRRQT
jgi:ankyrin repeat protein